MKKLFAILNSLIESANTMVVGKSEKDYTLIIGFLTTPIVFFVEIGGYFLSNPSMISTNLPHLVIALVQIFLFAGFWASLKVPNFKDSPLVKIVSFVYPYTLIFGSIWVAYVSQGYSNNYYSYFIGVIAAALIQVYPLVKRLVMFFIAQASFLVVMYLAVGFTPFYVEALRLSTMIVITAYIYATVFHLLFTHQKKAVNQLDLQNTALQSSMEQLEKAYQSLNESYQITESMMKSTTTILKNDRLDDVLQLVLEEAMRLVPKAQAGSVLVVNGEYMEFRAAVGYDLKKLQKVQLPLEETFQAHLENKYVPTIIRDLQVFDDAHLDKQNLDLLKKANATIAKSCLSCSFKYEDEFFGSLNLDNFDSSEIYDQRDMDMLDHFSKEVEIIIAIHKLYEKAILPTRFDELTKVYTRRYFNQLAEASLKHGQKTKHTVTMSLVDINNLKEFNDEFGHDIGDEYLISIVETIRSRIPKYSFMGRIGGDEFAIVFPDYEFSEVIQFMNDARYQFQKTGFMASRSHIEASFAFGVSSTDEVGYQATDLLSMADSRMYEDKKQLKRK